MAKRRGKPDPKSAKQPSEPLYHATVSYKLWARRLIANRKPKKWTLAELAEKVTRNGFPVTDAALSQFLGRADEAPTPSNCAFMPGLNKALGAAPPRHCEPDNPVAQLLDALAARWNVMSPDMRRTWFAIAEIPLPTEIDKKT